MSSHQTYRLAVLASHPIQYQVPLFRFLASQPEIDLTVLFCSDWGLKIYRDEGFGRELKWDIPLLDGFHSEFLPNISPKPNLSSFWGLINPAVASRLRNGNFDAVWVHGWARFTDWFAMQSAFALGIPVLMRGDTTLLPTPPRWRAMVKRVILTRLFRKVSGFLAIGRYNAELYQAYGVPKGKIFLVPYAVDNDFFLPRAEDLLPKKIELKRKFGIPANLPVILFSGKLVEIKRPTDLLMAFAQVSETIKAALVYVGDGPLRSKLEAYVREFRIQHVYFMGFRNQMELPMFYALADVLVLPSGFEAWGLVVNEAMCFGLPVIVSDQVGAAGDLVQERLNGHVYPVGNITVLAERLAMLLANEVLRQKMGNASRSIISGWSYQHDFQGILASLRRIGLPRSARESIDL